MSEYCDYYHRWEPLAEFHFNLSNENEPLFDDDSIYCLCSRVLTRENVKTYEVDQNNWSESDVDVAPDAPSSGDHSHVHFSVDTSYKVKCDKDDGASCYCSASHTDNYCSTDEHDVGQTIPSNILQPSDSGADLTYQDYNSDYIGPDNIPNHDQEVSKLDNYEDYLSQDTWAEFWAAHGERLIWASWIEKYSDYINPDYLDDNNDLLLDENRVPQKYEVKPVLANVEYQKNTNNTRERKYSYDSKIRPCSEENKDDALPEKQGKKGKGLTDTQDDSWISIGRRRSCSEHERIVSPKTLAGTDSMTNVTKATLSSYNVTSSHVTSNSSPTDGYSITSSTSDDQFNDQTRIANIDETTDTVLSEELDNDMYWQVLWKNHFGEQYALHYNYYIESHNIHNEDKEDITEVFGKKAEKCKPNDNIKFKDIQEQESNLELKTSKQEKNRNNIHTKPKQNDLENTNKDKEMFNKTMTEKKAETSVSALLQHLIIGENENEPLEPAIDANTNEKAIILNTEKVNAIKNDSVHIKKLVTDLLNQEGLKPTECDSSFNCSQDIPLHIEEKTETLKKCNNRQRQIKRQKEYKIANSIGSVLQRLLLEQQETQFSGLNENCSDKLDTYDESSLLNSDNIKTPISDNGADSLYVQNSEHEILKVADMESEIRDGDSKDLASTVKVKTNKQRKRSRKNAASKDVDDKLNNLKEYKQVNSMSALLQHLLNEQKENTCNEPNDAGDEKSNSQGEVITNDAVDSSTLTENPVQNVQDNSPNSSHNSHRDEDENNDPPENRNYSLKRSHELDADEVVSEKIKCTFEMMGFALNTSEFPKGELIYKKRNSKLRPPRNKRWETRQQKTYFDDDGNSYYDKGFTERYSEDDTPCELDDVRNSNLESVNVNEDTNEDVTDNSNQEEENVSNVTQQASDDHKDDADINLKEDGAPGGELRTDMNESQNEIKRRKRQKRHLRHEDRRCELPEELKGQPKMIKYWKKRHSLFHRFDEGIRLDLESWFSVTPENVAAHIADRCAHHVVLDAFCGAGGNAIQFARTCKKVIAIDIDPVKVELARHNARVYGVLDNIEFIVGDFFQVGPTLQADFVFLSPPWGGPKYSQNSEYDIETMLEPRPASDLVDVAKKINSKIALYLPRNSKTDQIIHLAQDLGESVEIEQSFLDKRFVAITAYFY